MKRMACALAFAAGAGVIAGPMATAASADPTFAKLANGLQLSVVNPGYATADAPVSLDVNYKGGAIRSVELYVDNNKVFKQTVKSTDTQGNFSLKLDTSLMPEGDHDVLVIATEADGSTASSSLKIHVAGPVVSGIAEFSYPRANAMVQNVVPVEVKLDANIKAPYVAYLLDNEFLSIRNYAPYVYNWDSSKVSDGPHTIAIEVYDSTTQELLKKTTVQVIVKNVGGFTNIQTKTPTVVGPRNTNRIVEIIGGAASEPVSRVADDAANIVRGNSVSNTYTLRGAEPRSSTFFASEARPSSIIPALEPTREEGGAREATGVAAAPGGVAPSMPRPFMFNLPALIAEPEVLLSRTLEQGDVTHARLNPVTAGNVASRPSTHPTARPKIQAMVITPFITPPVAYIRSHRVNGLKTFDIAFNNSRIAFDVQPRVEHGMPLAPFRAIFEHTGGSVRWYAQSQTIRAVSSSRQIEFKIGDKTARVNNKVVKLAHVPYVENGRTIVPLSFVSEAMNVKVTYDARNSFLSIEGKAKN